MQKKIGFIALTLVLVLALSACGIKDGVQNAISDALSGESSSDTGDHSDDADKDADSNSSSSNPIGKITLSNATDKWPSGVYNAYSIPEYKAGKVVYTYPEDEAGSVFIETTREDMLAYIDGLLAKGFRMSEGDYERMQERSWESFEIFFPDYGGAFGIEGHFSFENDGKGTSTWTYDDDGNDVEFYYNFSLHMAQHGSPEGWTRKDLLAAVGISDDALIFSGADKSVGSIDVTFSMTDPVYIMFEIDFTFDYNLTREFWVPYTLKLAQAFIDASDDGKIVETFTQEPIDLATKQEDGVPGFLYTHGGKTFMVQLAGETGYGEELTIVVQQLQVN